LVPISQGLYVVDLDRSGNLHAGLIKEANERGFFSGQPAEVHKNADMSA
jgi:hypothetical protein